MYCWQASYTAKHCCDITHGNEGLEECWGGEFNYSACCTVVPLRAKVQSPIETSSSLQWCGTVCDDSPVGQDRVWEALRYHLFTAMEARHLPERFLLGTLGEAVLSMFKGLPPEGFAELEKECTVGSLALLLLRDAGSSFNSTQRPELLKLIMKVFTSPNGLQQVLCSGWPVFRALSLAAANLSNTHPHASQLHSRFFQGQVVDDAFRRCFAEHEFSSCLGAARPLLERLHGEQSSSVFGTQICPKGAFVAWLDRMHPASTFPLCVRASYNRIDDELRRRGMWKDCQELADVVAVTGSPGCHILDVGANLGTCTVMLAHLGYQVTAFEPLLENVKLLEASITLNQISPAFDRGEWHQFRNAGSAKVHQCALGDETGFYRMREGKRNAGMSVVEPVAGEEYICDERAFLCDRAPQSVQVKRLDDIWKQENGEVCLMKIDVEGWEMRVLRGALTLLRARMLRTLMLEWWPPHLASIGEEPVSMLWLLHALKYEIYAPAQWFTHATDDNRWLMVVPAQFPYLLSHWGDILAIASA